MESRNVKALFRRAQACTETADLDLAELDIKKALEIDPSNRYACQVFAFVLWVMPLKGKETWLNDGRQRTGEADKLSSEANATLIVCFPER